MHVLISGGTGLLGRSLLYELVRKGHEVSLLTRDVDRLGESFPAKVYQWPGQDHHFPVELVQNVEAIIHLSGEGIANKRWSKEQKDKIRSSRIESTRKLANEFRSAPKLHSFLCSSAVGFYGHRGDEELSEESGPGDNFLAGVCKEWEAEAMSLDLPERRVALLRTGVVLTRKGGFLTEMESLFRKNTGGPVAGGAQWLSWIHHQDWQNAVLHCLENRSLRGPINLTAPEPETQRNFSIRMGEVFKKTTQLPAPGFAVKLALGEMSSLALDSQRAIPKKLLSSGFQFKYKELQEALNHLYKITDLEREISPLFYASQWVPIPIEKAFEFFKDEKNLEKITPAFLNFKVEKKSTEKLGPGTLIDYTLKIHGVPARWQSRIDNWNPPHLFSDTQTKGPYKKWFHIHGFESLGEGTLLTDNVFYELPLGVLGTLFGSGFVKKDVSQIFAYRKKVIFEMFG